MSVRVWSPIAGIPVRLKVEEHGDATHSVETEATVTTASGWQTLEFNFANQATGSSALNLNYNYDKASIFFNFGTTGAVAGEQTYYFDDVMFVTDVTPVNQDDVLNLISIFPNPFVETVIISNKTNTALNIRLFDMLGRELKKITSNITNIQINMSAYPSGTYFIWIENKNNNKKVCRKVVKQ